MRPRRAGTLLSCRLGLLFERRPYRKPAANSAGWAPGATSASVAAPELTGKYRRSPSSGVFAPAAGFPSPHAERGGEGSGVGGNARSEQTVPPPGSLRSPPPTLASLAGEGWSKRLAPRLICMNRSCVLSGLIFRRRYLRINTEIQGVVGRGAGLDRRRSVFGRRSGIRINRGIQVLAGLLLRLQTTIR